MVLAHGTIRTSALRLALIAVALVVASTAPSPAAAETSDAPKFRAGLWRFDRTREYPDHRVVVQRNELTRCVDPTHAMKGTFSSPNIGSCRSDKAERIDNRFTFANRCDYLGPVRTDITVHSEDAYTEVNFIKTSQFPQVDKVNAQRIGDCNGNTPEQAVSVQPGRSLDINLSARLRN